MAREVTLVDAGLGNMASVERALIQVGAGVRVTNDPDKVATARMVVFPWQSAFGAATRAIVDGAMGAALKMVIERGDPFLGICLGMQLLFDGSDENGGQTGLKVLPGWCRRFPDEMEIDAEKGAVEHDNVPAAPAPDDAAPAQSTSPEGAGFGPTPVPVAANEDPAGLALDNPPSPPSPFDAGGGPAVAAAAAPPLVSPADAAPKKLRRRLKVPHMGWNSVEPTGEHYYFVHSYYVVPERSEDVMWMSTYGTIRFAAAIRRGNVMGCQFHPEKSQRAGLKFLRAFLLGGWG
jgi:imidazoleglycerol phosphate synthase glutamine amidotransferase subunit HisH